MTLRPLGRPFSPATWDREYQAGVWDYLNEVREAGRYGVIAAYTRCFGPGGRILDLGCGEAILYRYVESFVAAYTGIDVSACAIDRARVDADRGQLLCADIASYPLAELGRFHVAIANEVLYHLEDPLALLHRVRGQLAQGGVLIVSMFDPRADSRWSEIVSQIWESLDACGWPRLAAARITDGGSRSWQIRVFGGEI